MNSNYIQKAFSTPALREKSSARLCPKHTLMHNLHFLPRCCQVENKTEVHKRKKNPAKLNKHTLFQQRNEIRPAPTQDQPEREEEKIYTHRKKERTQENRKNKQWSCCTHERKAQRGEIEKRLAVEKKENKISLLRMQTRLSRSLAC